MNKDSSNPNVNHLAFALPTSFFFDSKLNDFSRVPLLILVTPKQWEVMKYVPDVKRALKESYSLRRSRLAKHWKIATSTESCPAQKCEWYSVWLRRFAKQTCLGTIYEVPIFMRKPGEEEVVTFLFWSLQSPIEGKSCLSKLPSNTKLFRKKILQCGEPELLLMYAIFIEQRPRVDTYCMLVGDDFCEAAYCQHFRAWLKEGNSEKAISST